VANVIIAALDKASKFQLNMEKIAAYVHHFITASYPN
jgi:hypothetical protein